MFRSFARLGARAGLFTQHLHRFSRGNATDASTGPVRRLPKWAQKYADRLKSHPASHVTSFLVLHELTAIVPLPILFWFFHSFDWTPAGLPTDLVEKGVKAADKQLSKWGFNYTGNDESRYVFEGAAAYAVVKMLLPLRVGLSLSLTPWFARRIVVPITRQFKRTKPVAKGPEV
ncbi:hypothetical protein BCR37DRAFT_392757 [Protomyces lactucae-debilis]|uniref:Uncharacterized protein n=1 Tax=Protomyces lactucae-debilis TaxID=2754530 RepID=A0A1Y2FI98_PROLT|nr:uncharacterized protein BCR37DRAFT_392757 [Protomyces lactucae-debilis]ORY82545.1 hypothetical protein BCR37DRAFT_392757 [Protomyces lactucae-debilis]